MYVNQVEVVMKSQPHFIQEQKDKQDQTLIYVIWAQSHWAEDKYAWTEG